MHDQDNDGRFPDESPVEVRYPRSKQEEQGDREQWPWLPGTIVEQCGPDEWYVCIEVRELGVLRNGRRAPRGTASRNLYYPCCFRDGSEIRAAHRLQRCRLGDEAGGGPVSGDRVIRLATAAAVGAVAAFAAVVSYSHIYGLGRVHGQDGTAARLLPLSVDELILAASLVLLHEARNGRDAPGAGQVHAVARHQRHDRREHRLRHGIRAARGEKGGLRRAQPHQGGGAAWRRADGAVAQPAVSAASNPALIWPSPGPRGAP